MPSWRPALNSRRPDLRSRLPTYNERDGLLNSCVWALAEDANHDLWIGTYGGGVFRFRGGGFTQYSKAQGLASDRVTGIVPARDGSLWFVTRGGLSRMRNGQVHNYTTADGLSSNHATNLYEDRTGVIRVGTTKGVDRMSGGRFVNVSSIPRAVVFPIGEDRSGGLYLTVVPKEGVFRVENNRPISVAPNTEPTNMVETNDGEVWLSGDSILRVPPGGLRRSRGPDEPLDYAELGIADGLASTQASVGQPNSTLTRDGRLWAATPQGLAMLDLPNLPRTNRKPAIYMEEVTVGRNVQPAGHELVLPRGTHHVELHFDASEISSPEKIRLQYRLDSVDSEWLDTGHPAHAIYSAIPAGTHAFHVRACNRDGIWDRAGMVYSITQQPYFYQTASFQFATVTSGFLVRAGLHRLRLRRATAQLNARLEERLAERERIARELHDTLLQGIQGLMWCLQAGAAQIPVGEPARQLIESALDRADEVIVEGRDRVNGLRTAEEKYSDLSETFAIMSAELAKEHAIPFQIILQGTPRALNPIVCDDACQIGREALVNAFRHSLAQKIETEITFARTELRLRIRDNGCGVESKILEGGGRPGHCGMTGMREQARKIDARLDIWSRQGNGTEVDLRIPASRAYLAGMKGWRWPWSGYAAHKGNNS